MSIETLQDRAEQLLRATGVMPVLTVDSVDQGLRMADALAEGGLKTLELTLRTPAAAPTVRGDADLLLDLLCNLVQNAAKASAPGAPMLVLCAQAGDAVTLTVADRGCGIPPELIPRVTEPFYMVDKSRARRQGGSGLGLALCQRIAAAHGSALRIESEPGRGTRVSVTLPVWKEDAP